MRNFCQVVAVTLIASLTAGPSFANKFAACGFIEAVHPSLKCTAVKLPQDGTMLGEYNIDPATGKTILDVYVSGIECKKLIPKEKYDVTGRYEQRKKIGRLQCNNGVMTFNNKKITNPYQ